MSTHGNLSPERWARFTLAQQILMIANEMERGRADLRPERGSNRAYCYERVLELVDLTVRGTLSPSMRRELMRWREIVAGLYADERENVKAHEEAMRTLLELTPESALQVPLLGL